MLNTLDVSKVIVRTQIFLPSRNKRLTRAIKITPRNEFEYTRVRNYKIASDLHR